MKRNRVEVAPCTKNKCRQWFIMLHTKRKHRNISIKLTIVGHDEFVGLGENSGSVGVAQCILFTTQFNEFVSLLQVVVLVPVRDAFAHRTLFFFGETFEQFGTYWLRSLPVQ